MARKKELMDYLDEFIEYGKTQGECMLNGDYKRGNKAYNKTEMIFNKAINSLEKETFYNTILNSTDDANTLTKCCAHMLRLNINPKIVRKKLKALAKDNNIHPIFKSNAKMFLQEWDKGNIKPIV